MTGSAPPVIGVPELSRARSDSHLRRSHGTNSPGGEPPPVLRTTSVLRSSPPRMPHHYDDGQFGKALKWDAGSLIINGRRTIIMSGEFHYWRFPDRSCWEEILLGYKAAGLNCVRIYFHWGFHSPRPGVYNFDGNRDVDALLRICENIGLWVLAAPGPYICAETSGGGFPFWLLESRHVRIRHMQTTGLLRFDQEFMDAQLEWWKAIVPILAAHEVTKTVLPEASADAGTGPARAAKKGCILMFQVDNELFEKKLIPLGLHRHMYDLSISARRLGVTVPFFHDDGLLWGSWLGSSSPSRYSVDVYGFNLYVIFAPGSVWGGKATDKQFPVWQAKDFVKMVDGIETGFRALGRGAVSSPIFIPELQVGWFNRWGLKQDFDDLYTFYGERFSQLLVASCIAQGCSLASMYTFCGGTNWGALPDPDVYTSYDYAAPLREYRHPSAKLHLLRTAVLQPARAFEEDFATSRAVKEGQPLSARAVSLDGQPPLGDGQPLLAKHRESDRGVQICLLRNLAPDGGPRRLVVRLGGTEVRAELQPREAFFAFGHVPESEPYLLLSGIPILSYGVYGAAASGNCASADEEAATASAPAKVARGTQRGGAAEDLGEDLWFVRCVPQASMCFRGHLSVVEEMALPMSAGPEAAYAAAAAVPEGGSITASVSSLELDFAATCLPSGAAAPPLTHGRSDSPPDSPDITAPGSCVRVEHSHANVQYPLASEHAISGGAGVAVGCFRMGARNSVSAAAMGVATVTAQPPVHGLAMDADDGEPVTSLRFRRPCVIRVAAAADQAKTQAPPKPAAGNRRPPRAAVIICLGDADADSLVTYHSYHEGAPPVPGAVHVGEEPRGRFGACWGITSAVFGVGGSELRATATGEQQLFVLPPEPNTQPASVLERAPWAQQAQLGGVSAASSLAKPPPDLPVSVALGAVRTCVVGTESPEAALLDRQVSAFEATTFHWDKLDWKQINIKKRDSRDSLYHGFNGGLSFYRCTFDANSATSSLRLRLNARHRFAVYLNGHFVGASTVYASAMLKAGAPNGPDMTSFGTRTLRLQQLVTGRNEVRVIVHSFGQSRCPVILDDARNPRGILYAKVKGPATNVAWFIAGLDCKGLTNAFATDGVPPKALGTVFHALPLPPEADSEVAHDAGPPASGFSLDPNDGIVHARAYFALGAHAASTPEGAKVRCPLRLHLEGACCGYMSLNGTPISRYHGDMGPQASFFLPDGLLHGPGEANSLTFTGHATQPTVLRVRVRAYSVDLRSGNLLEPADGGRPVQTSTVTLQLSVPVSV